MKKVITIASMAIIVYGCSKKMATAKTPMAAVPKPMVAPPVEAVVTLAPASETVADENKKVDMGSVKDGQPIFETKCNRCHELKNTASYTQAGWVTILEKMSENAKLTNEEKVKVSAYVRYNARDGLKNRPAGK